MYKKARVYKCNICGKEEVTFKEYDINSAYWPYPKGWAGTFRSHGASFCPLCSRQIEANSNITYEEWEKELKTEKNWLYNK